MNLIIGPSRFLLAATLTLASLVACASATDLSSEHDPIHTRVVQDDNGWHFERGGERYFVTGAGGFDDLDQLVERGGNSIRLWGTDGIGPILDAAHERGLSVAVGIWLMHEHHEFDYDNPEDVKKQYDQAVADIKQYKDHPAVLCWGIGNEMEGAEGRPAIWKAVNDIAKAAKQIDPHHPTMTVIAEFGHSDAKVKGIETYCPDIDIVGLNSYGGIGDVVDRYRKLGGTKPVMITEFGPLGHWEVPQNEWGAPHEATSGEKAAHYRRGYEMAVKANPDVVIGSYAFLWGWKQETTYTWYGMLLPEGKHLAAVDVMQEMWTGSPPSNRVPQIGGIRVHIAHHDAQGMTVQATVDATDPEGDALEYRWVLRAAAKVLRGGGYPEDRLPEYPDAIAKNGGTQVTVNMPKLQQGYRLFCYVTDSHDGAAVANVPISNVIPEQHTSGSSSSDSMHGSHSTP